MDCQPLHGISGIQAPSRSTGRIQRKVHVSADGFTRGVLRHACGSRARNLSQRLSTRNALAIHGNTLSGLGQIHDNRSLKRFVQSIGYIQPKKEDLFLGPGTEINTLEIWPGVHLSLIRYNGLSLYG